MTSWDAIVVGAGPNGMVAANHLADAGWNVLILEAQREPGGAVRSARDVHPDFVHDTFSSFYPLAAASPTIQSFGLDEYGLEWAHSPAVLGHPLPDGDWALITRDHEATSARLDQQHPGDGAAWLELCARWDQIGDQLVSALMSPFPPIRGGVGALARLRKAGGLDFVKLLLSPARDVCLSRFGGQAAQLLIAGNAGHADIPLTSPGSGLMGVLLSMLAQTVGYPVPVGGAGELTSALVRRFESKGGELRCDTAVTKVVVKDGRAVAVETSAGQTIAVSRGVVADVGASQLYGGLVGWDDLPARVRRDMSGFQIDPSTIKVDWALDGQVPWANQPAAAPGTVHIGDSVSQITEALGQVAAGYIPAAPFMLVGQMSTADPSRSPGGTEALWAYTHVPQETVGDVGDDGLTGVWDHDELERFADRMQARLEAHASDLASRIVARRVLGPHELESRNANLIGGAINGGTSQLHQQLIFRPVAGLGRAETPVKGLFLGSASAHPGGGVHGACGMNAARAAIAHDRLRLRRPRLVAP